MLNTQEFIYTVDMFCDILHLPVETPDNPFVTPVNIETIEVFMNKVGYQGVVDKVSAFYTKNLAQPWQTMFKKFPEIPQRIEEDYHSVKDDIPLVVCTLLGIPVWGCDTEDRLEPGSHKDKPENVVDDDDKYDEKVDEKEGGETGSLETKTDKMHTPILTPPRSLRTILSSDKNITHELTETELIENNLKPCIAAMIIEDRDAFRFEVPDLVSQEFNAQAPKIIEDLFKNYVQINVIQVHPTTTTSSKTTSSADLQQQLYFKMKRSLQDRANDLALDDDIHSHHDDHQDNDAPPKREKRVKRHKVSKSLKSARGSSSKHSAKESTTYVSKQQQQQQQQEWDAWVEEIVIDEDEVIPEDETSKLITEL
ncbi:hypothetical protein Tco_0475394 [Tanacetum coccineum]